MVWVWVLLVGVCVVSFVVFCGGVWVGWVWFLVYLEVVFVFYWLLLLWWGGVLLFGKNVIV